MSIQSEITRLSTAKAAISTAITGKGVTVPSTTKLDGLAPLISQISTEAELQSISIITAPAKTSYIAGDAFDPTGMAVKAVISGVEVEVAGWTYSPTTMAAGTTSVTVSYTLGGVTKTAAQEVTVAFGSAVFSENSWETIANIAKAGGASQLWNVGDEKKITYNGYTLTTIILGFDTFYLDENDPYYHSDDYNDGGYLAAILLGFKELIPQTTMIFDSSNRLWKDSTAKSNLEQQVFLDLPVELTSVIRIVTAITRYSAGSVTYDASTIFLPSAFEIFGTTNSNYYNIAGEGIQFAYYAAGNSRVKRDTKNVAQNHMTRSTASWSSSSLATDYNVIVNTSNNISQSSKSISQYVSPCFCI